MSVQKNVLEYTETLSDSFISQHTAFPTFKAMLCASGIEAPEDLSREYWNSFVVAHSQFSSWREMQRKAAREWATRKLAEANNTCSR